jgi:hypothetical protein
MFGFEGEKAMLATSPDFIGCGFHANFIVSARVE